MNEFVSNYIEYIIFFAISLILCGAVVYFNRKKEARARTALLKSFENNTNEPQTLHPYIDHDICIGCGTCTQVCPEGKVLQLINNKSTLISADKCVGHGECETSCPMGAIKLVFGTKDKGMEIPKLSTNYESNISGLYVVGELGGMGLIRNAVKQGTLAAEHALKNISNNSKTQYDIIIVGAGPAGFAASLAALKENKNYLCIEQNSFGGTISHFPRQKIVMSRQVDLPITGKMKFSKDKISKVELINYLTNIVNKTGLKIVEDCRFESVQKIDDVFIVNTNKGDFTASKVILATGVRGTPRELGIQNEDKEKVSYSLSDAEEYQSLDLTVVGGGNSAVEAAYELAQKNLNNTVHLLVRNSSFTRCNEENQKRILELQKNGRVNIWFNSSVHEISENELLVIKENEQLRLKNDFLFILIGAELPTKFLKSVGIQTELKYGEGCHHQPPSSVL